MSEEAKPEDSSHEGRTRTCGGWPCPHYEPFGYCDRLEINRMPNQPLYWMFVKEKEDQDGTRASGEFKE